MTDPYGTAALRAAVLDAWATSPTRFREDANAEEDLRLGGYARTWLVELAQNAADAARSGGVDGRVRVVVERGELRVANTGAPLDTAGVAALASLRASAKRDSEESVGRFGVGFAAVLALSDAPRLLSTGAGVVFSAARTAAAVAALPGPAAELARRDGQLPILRLAWPVESDEAPVPEGYDTEVRLPLRAGVDPAALLAGARVEAASLLLALPDLVEIVVDGVALCRADGRDGEVCISIDGRPSRWLLVRRSGRLDAGGAAALAVEQRGRLGWSVCWALPLDADGRPVPLSAAESPGGTGLDAGWGDAEPWRGPAGPGGGPGAVDRGGDGADRDHGGGGGGEVLYAPTATAERLSLPARLIATVPLEPDRRHVRPGPVTDRILAAAAVAYVDLVLAVDPALRLALLPGAGFPRSETDGQLRDLVLAQLRSTAWLPGVDGTDLAPGRAQWLDLPAAALPALIGECGAFPGLLAPVPGLSALGALGVARLAPAELADRLLGVEMPPVWWHAVYAELAPAADTVPGLVDELRALPVPLVTAADTHFEPRSAESGHELHGRSSCPDSRDHGPERRAGRTVAGPASVLLPSAPAAPAAPGSSAGLETPAAWAASAVEAIAALGLPGLHIAHPAAVHPLLARLGAVPADHTGLLDHPAVRAAIERSIADADAGLDPAPLAAAVLGLVAEAGAGVASGGQAALALPESGGGAARADELMLPDAALRPLLADDVPIGVLDPSWAARFPRDVLVRIGVVDGFAVLVDDDPTGPDHDLDDENRWWDTLDAPPARLVAIRDLDLVAADAWPAALALLAAHRETRDAILATPSYTAWWLARHTRLSGHRPEHWRLPSATALTALYDPLPPDVLARTGTDLRENVPLDDGVLAAIGVRTGLCVANSAAAAGLLARLADPDRHPGPALVGAAHAELAAAVLAGRVDPADLEPPQRVRALDGNVTDVEFAVVLDLPWLAAALPPGETVLGGGVGEEAEALAELLDLPLASDVVTGTVDGDGRAIRWADLAEVVVVCQGLGVDVPDGELHHHETLTVNLTRPVARRSAVPVWRTLDGRWHAADPVRALLALLAEADGR